VASLDALAAITAAADVNIELTDDGSARDFGLVLLADRSFLNGAATMRASVGKGRLMDFVDSSRGWGQAVAMPAVGGPGLTARSLGLGLGWPLGEGCGLAFACTLGLLQLGQRLLQLSTGLLQFALQALVLPAQTVVLALEGGDPRAKVIQFAKNRNRDRHRVTNLQLDRC
jgi:hypothetical protein